MRAHDDVMKERDWVTGRQHSGGAGKLAPLELDGLARTARMKRATTRRIESVLIEVSEKEQHKGKVTRSVHTNDLRENERTNERTNERNKCTILPTNNADFIRFS